MASRAEVEALCVCGREAVDDANGAGLRDEDLITHESPQRR
jgi:hypothetical protein